MMIVTLTESRRKRISEILGNISVGWFAGGVIAPAFIRDRLIGDYVVSFVFGFAAFLMFFGLSIYIEDYND
jgi:hypothetical protein